MLISIKILKNNDTFYELTISKLINQNIKALQCFEAGL